ncbi:MAG: hypothetical protein Fur0042_20020 [Cyanophyceae cyanobacterium]
MSDAFHAEFAGPGAVVYSPVEPSYCQIVAIGQPCLIPIKGRRERILAFRRRMDWLRWQRYVTRHEVPAVRADRLLQSFEGWFGVEVTRHLPDEPLAQLAAVLPVTMAQVRRRKKTLGTTAMAAPGLGDTVDSYWGRSGSTLWVAAPRSHGPQESGGLTAPAACDSPVFEYWKDLDWEQSA